MTRVHRGPSPSGSLARPKFIILINLSKDGELNKKLSNKSVDYMIKKYCRLIGVEGKITVHSARSTVIGSLLEKGVSIDKVAQFVGHSDLGTTKAYNKRKVSIKDSPAFNLEY